MRQERKWWEISRWERNCLRKSRRTSWRRGLFSRCILRVFHIPDHIPLPSSCPRGMYIPEREMARNQIAHCKKHNWQSALGILSILMALRVKSRGPEFWRVSMVCLGMRGRRNWRWQHQPQWSFSSKRELGPRELPKSSHDHAENPWGVAWDE